jgi:DnaK suppressor protein
MTSSEHKKAALTSEDLAALKADLIERKQALWDEMVQDLERDAKADHQELIDSIRDRGDEALEELRERTVFSLIEMKHDELQRIEDAIRRIESGEYGRCVDCGERIGLPRLRAMPYAVRCRRCQAEQETRERV